MERDEGTSPRTSISPAEAEQIYRHLTHRLARRRRLRAARGAVLVAAVLAGTVTGAVALYRAFAPPHAVTGPAAGPATGGILFSRGGQRGGLYLTNADGTGLTRLTTNGGDAQASWSPDGTRVAFVRFVAGNANVYVMNADGGGLIALTRDGADSGPSWSPDGSKILFSREVGGNADLFVVGADGRGLTRLTRDSLMEYAPAWSSGHTIAFMGFVRSPGGPAPVPGLYVMGADGTSMRRIAPGSLVRPAWSPDGTRIAFVGGTGSIHVIGADGKGSTKIFDAKAVGGTPITSGLSWSPNGTEIAFATGSSAGRTHVYVIGSDGSGLRSLTAGPAPDADPAWRP